MRRLLKEPQKLHVFEEDEEEEKEKRGDSILR